MESYNEAAIDCPPELLAASGQTDSARSSPGLASNVDGQSLVLSPLSDMQSPGAVQTVADWDTDQVNDRQTDTLKIVTDNSELILLHVSVFDTVVKFFIIIIIIIITKWIRKGKVTTQHTKIGFSLER